MYAFGFTLMVAGSLWLLDRGGWQRHFKLGVVEKGFVLIALIAIFALHVFSILPMASLKLVIMISVVIFPLVIHRHRGEEDTVFTKLIGTVRGRHLLGLLMMPLCASLVYAVAGILQPAESMIRTISEVFPVFQVLLGGAILLWAWIVSLRPLERLAVAAKSETS